VKKGEDSQSFRAGYLRINHFHAPPRPRLPSN
jgi:hypothetical protein